MQLIFGKNNAEELRQRFTVLDLETLEVEGQVIEVYCLIPGEKIALHELPNLDKFIQLHNDFLNGYHTKQFEYCRQCVEHLRGKFGGEVDTFYDEIMQRIDKVEAANV